MRKKINGITMFMIVLVIIFVALPIMHAHKPLWVIEDKPKTAIVKEEPERDFHEDCSGPKNTLPEGCKQKVR